MAVVRSAFRPEFLNRVDEIILFHRLKREQMSRIVDIQFKRLAKLLEDRKIAIKLDPAAREWLADKGYDPAYGARPLEARDPEGGAGPARRADPLRQGEGRRGGDGLGRAGQAEPRLQRRGSGERGGVRSATRRSVTRKTRVHRAMKSSCNSV